MRSPYLPKHILQNPFYHYDNTPDYFTYQPLLNPVPQVNMENTNDGNDETEELPTDDTPTDDLPGLSVIRTLADNDEETEELPTDELPTDELKLSVIRTLADNPYDNDL